jgi:hypothetical protein
MKTVVSLVLFIFAALVGHAQRIFYSDIEKDDYRQMNFDIIGKVSGKINIYKNYRNRNDISIYNDEMKLLNRVSMDFMPERVIQVDFIAYSDFYCMVYQYQKKNVVYCAYVKFNGDGKRMNDPLILDTSHLPSQSDKKVYSMINSEDKQRIMVFKVNRKNERYYVLTTLLFDSKPSLVRKSVTNYPIADREGFFTDFVLDNDGDFAFGRAGTGGNREFVNRFDFVIKKANEDTLQVYNIPLKDKSLDEVQLKPDNFHKKFIVTSFYYKQRKGNIDGLYTFIWDKNTSSRIMENTFVFSDSLRMDARTENVSVKQAFNDYFIKYIIPTRNGGFAVMSELYYTSSRSTGWNRWDYLYGYNYNPMDYWYYSPYNAMNYGRWWDPWSRWNSYSSTRYFAENIMIFFFNSEGKLEWSNVVRKTQFDDNNDMFLSFQIFNAGNSVRFLFNQLEKRELILNSATINAAGEMKRDPTLRNLDKTYDFMPRFGKQIALKEIVLPCMHKNFICFAKLEY